MRTTNNRAKTPYQVITSSEPHYTCTIFKSGNVVHTIRAQDLSHAQLLKFATTGLAIAARTAINATGIPRDEAVHLFIESVKFNEAKAKKPQES